MKTFRSTLFKKYLERIKSRVCFCLFLAWLHTSKKITENCNYVGAEAHKVEKVVRFWSNLDPNFPDIWKEREK